MLRFTPRAFEGDGFFDGICTVLRHFALSSITFPLLWGIRTPATYIKYKSLYGASSVTKTSTQEIILARHKSYKQLNFKLNETVEQYTIECTSNSTLKMKQKKIFETREDKV
jgi:hypothetical protein